MSLRVVFAGDRDISVWVLRFMIEQEVYPVALLTSDAQRQSHASELKTLCGHLDAEYIIEGTRFREAEGAHTLADLKPDYIVCVHFPYVISKAVLDIPRHGVLNLHPAYLPFNRGWHTPSWALLEETPVGATLHFMDEGVDTGDIVHQVQVIPSLSDTANSLYQKLKQAEFTVFQEAWPRLVSETFSRISQTALIGTSRKRKDLFSEDIQKINLDVPQTPRTLLRTLRALTTNDMMEAAYFEEGDKRYRVQVIIHEEQLGGSKP